ncbi:MAG: STAS domain-containing protein [Maribacter sp.]|uniref:STAS domain-containing protein n=1 Tax=Maribacter sp. TaxID=1897614 RepID=UPI0032977901
MALQITETRGMFSVFGELNSANANILARHMQRFLSKSDPVILNLERVRKLDVTAAHMLREMYYSAMRDNSVLSIVGLSNSNILGVLQKTKTSFIFSDDRI